MHKKLLILTAVLALALGLSAQAKPKVLTFNNPGSRRLLKTEQGNYYYYRALPEKSMTVNSKGIKTIELKSFAVEALKRPQVIVKIGKQSTTYDLSLAARLNGFYQYQPVMISIPNGIDTIDVLCYSRSVYFRPFYTPAPKPKAKAKARSKQPNMLITEHAGAIKISHNSTLSDYYSFNSKQDLRFTINNGRAGIAYTRVRLLDRSIPSFELYHNGKLVQTYEFSLKRTTQYKIAGITSLSVSKKINLDQGNGEYVLKAKSNHLFFARPLILKK